MDFISSNSLALLEKSFEYVAQKLNIHNENIANSVTPGYKAKYITFEEELRSSLRAATNPSQVAKAIENASPKVGVSPEESFTLDGNNVNVDSEYLELQRAQLQYDYIIQQVNGYFGRMNTVVNGR